MGPRHGSRHVRADQFRRHRRLRRPAGRRLRRLRGQTPGLRRRRPESKAFFQAQIAAFPELHLAAEDVIASGEKSSRACGSRGRERGELMGMPALRQDRQCRADRDPPIRRRRARARTWASLDGLARDAAARRDSGWPACVGSRARDLNACAGSGSPRYRRLSRRPGRRSQPWDVDPVADRANGRRQRPAGGLELRAQAREVRLQPLRIRVGLARPAGCQQPCVRHDAAVALRRARRAARIRSASA